MLCYIDIRLCREVSMFVCFHAQQENWGYLQRVVWKILLHVDIDLWANEGLHFVELGCFLKRCSAHILFYDRPYNDSYRWQKKTSALEYNNIPIFYSVTIVEEYNVGIQLDHLSPPKYHPRAM